MTITPVSATLPPLEDATHVVFIGHSGAAHGLYHNIDRLADMTRAAAGDAVDVRAIFDANFVSSIENEAAFGDVVGGGTPLAGDAYTNQWTGQTVDDASATFTYDGLGFHEDSWFGQQQISWKMRLDKSCLKAHAADEDWKCCDRYHVLFNHVATPFFFREDFTDPNSEHTQGGAGHPVPWGVPSGWTYPELLVVLPTCDAPRFAAATQHRARLETQATTLLADVGTRSELATGADSTFEDALPAVVVPTVYAWMPSCGSHEGAYGDEGFLGTSILDGMTSVTMRDWLHQFAAAPATNAVAAKMDGSALGTTMTSSCPP